MRRYLFVIIILLSPGVVFSATIKVPGDYSTIQQAIDASANGDTVLVGMGTYPENINFMGKAITVKSSSGAFLTILDGGSPVDPEKASVVTFDHNETPSSVLEGFTIMNGTGTKYGSSGYHLGSGIFCLNGASPTIKKNIITGNDNGSGVYTWGAGICCYFDANAKITGNTITANSLASAPGGQGGGICSVDSSPVIENNIISNNNGDTAGGAIQCIGSSWGPGHSAALITNNTISGNSSNYGAGIYFQRYNSGTSIDVAMNNSISGNSAAYDGGGIYSYDTAVTLRSNTISNNTAHRGGGVAALYGAMKILDNTIEANAADAAGGILCEHSTTEPLVQGNMVIKNTATYGAGIYGSSSAARITGNFILENKATKGGGGMWCHKCPSGSEVTSNVFAKNVSDEIGGGFACNINAYPKLASNTFHQNTAVLSGGGLYLMGASTVELVDTIHWDNSCTTGPEISVTGSSTLSVAYSDVKGGKSQVELEGGSTLNWGSGMIDTDPLFVNSASQDYHLSQDPCQPGITNPCVNKGDPTSPAIAGFTRTDGLQDLGVADMGFHYGPYHVLVTDTHEISEMTGGKANFTISAGADNANRTYLILGSVTGTSPGTPLPGGKAVLPINWDVFTGLVITLLNTPVFDKFMGTLDEDGSGTATLFFYPVPGTAGLNIYFAYALTSPWDASSNAVKITIVP